MVRTNDDRRNKNCSSSRQYIEHFNDHNLRFALGKYALNIRVINDVLRLARDTFTLCINRVYKNTFILPLFSLSDSIAAINDSHKIILQCVPIIETANKTVLRDDAPKFKYFVRLNNRIDHNK